MKDTFIFVLTRSKTKVHTSFSFCLGPPPPPKKNETKISEPNSLSIYGHGLFYLTFGLGHFISENCSFSAQNKKNFVVAQIPSLPYEKLKTKIFASKFFKVSFCRKKSIKSVLVVQSCLPPHPSFPRQNSRWCGIIG